MKKLTHFTASKSNKLKKSGKCTDYNAIVQKFMQKEKNVAAFSKNLWKMLPNFFPRNCEVIHLKHEI